MEDIICIDETSVSTKLSNNYCRSELGDRCVIKTDDNQVFKKYSLIVAISNQKCLGYELYEKGAVNGERFNEFLKKICDKNKKKLFILDNGKIHKTDETKEMIEKSENYLLFTLPYHPRLNCIEQFFNQMKHYIKVDKPKTFTDLSDSVKNSIKKVKKENYENYFTYAYNKAIIEDINKKDEKKTPKKKKESNKKRKPKIYKWN